MRRGFFGRRESHTSHSTVQRQRPCVPAVGRPQPVRSASLASIVHAAIVRRRGCVPCRIAVATPASRQSSRSSRSGSDPRSWPTPAQARTALRWPHILPPQHAAEARYGIQRMAYVSAGSRPTSTSDLATVGITVNWTKSTPWKSGRVLHALPGFAPNEHRPVVMVSRPLEVTECGYAPRRGRRR
jgi:hypothetical protein